MSGPSGFFFLFFVHISSVFYFFFLFFADNAGGFHGVLLEKASCLHSIFVRMFDGRIQNLSPIEIFFFFRFSMLFHRNGHTVDFTTSHDGANKKNKNNKQSVFRGTKKSCSKHRCLQTA